MSSTSPYRVFGADESYYTGKLEAYLRAKGITHELVPFSRKNIVDCARHTGIVQIPQLECPDGSWLIDTTPTIAYLEDLHPAPAITPPNPLARFVSLLLEDYADEWLWRPAMHYRWSYPDSARLLCGWLAEHVAEEPGPFFLKRLYWRVRQTVIFVWLDGVSSGTRGAVEASYLESLDALEAIFADRDFILGARPTEADFGFFASMYRHFFCDPASGRIMRQRAPGVMEWVARMWNLAPSKFEKTATIDTVPDKIEPLLKAVATIYLPYLAANATAYAAGQKRVSYRVQGVSWNEPTKPYRVWCLTELQREFQALSKADRSQFEELLDDSDALRTLGTPVPKPVSSGPQKLPIPADAKSKPVDSWWRGK